jgi:hypothetical protein
MAIGAYIASANWVFPLGDDNRQTVGPGQIILLDDDEAAAALTQRTIAGAASLTDDQAATLAAKQGDSSVTLGSRASLVAALGLV